VTPWEGAPWTPRRWQAECLSLLLPALKARKRAVVSAIMGAGKSALSAELCHLARPGAGARAIILAVPTQALVRQSVAVLRQRLGEPAVGAYYSDRKEPRRPVIVTCYPSLASLHADLLAAGRETHFLLVDEVHRSEAESILEVIPRFGAAVHCGLSATPYRSIPKESLTLWDEVVYRYTLEDALRDGVLVPMRRVQTPSGMHDADVDEVVLGMILEHGDGPGIVSAREIADAEAYAGWLTERGIEARAIHSRLSTGEQAARLAELREGALRCLVHVSLLAEGVDMPWLRWIALRRPVAARVRFVQEIGRVLRAHPGKTEGVVLDPHDLLGIHGLTHTEAIGQRLEEMAEAELRERDPDADHTEAERQAVAIDVLLGHLRMLVTAMREAGIIGQPRINGEGWRAKPITERQLAALDSKRRAPTERQSGARTYTRYVAPEYRPVIRLLATHPHALTCGAASDLLDVLYGSAQWGWREKKRLGLPPNRSVSWDARMIDLDPLDVSDAERAMKVHQEAA
jgi:superfamily II DNA or RNA helicase